MAPQSPPPAVSSEETAYGSDFDSEEEEEIAHSPPPAAHMTIAPPPQKGQESKEEEEENHVEEEDDEEEGEEEEEEEEDDEEGEEEEEEEEDEEGEEEEEEEGEEEEEEEELENHVEDEEESHVKEEEENHVAPPVTAKYPSSPPRNREESESSGDEEEEDTDEEAPQPTKQEAEGTGESDDKKPFQRTWSKEDEVRILEAMAAHRREHGMLPQPEALAAALAGSLDNSGCNLGTLQGKLKTLKRRYSEASKKAELPSKDHDRRLFDLSKSVWGSVTAADGGARRDFQEMCELYPYLAEEVKALQKEHPGMFKREFEMMGDEKACALDQKIKRQRLHQIKLYQRRCDLDKEVTRTLIDLMEH